MRTNNRSGLVKIESSVTVILHFLAEFQGKILVESGNLFGESPPRSKKMTKRSSQIMHYVKSQRISKL